MASAADFAAAIRGRFDADPGVTKIHKLLYYCQGWHLVWAGEVAFNERIYAWKMGPVVADLWRAEKYGLETEIAPLSDAESRTVEYVVKRYGHLWASQLIGQTHTEEPWLHAEGENQGVFALDVMKNFFASDPAADQAWFWDPAWSEGEAEADEDIREGRTATFETTEDFVDDLMARRADQ